MSSSSAYKRIIDRRAAEWQGNAPVDALGAYVAASNVSHHLDIFAGEVAAWSAADASEARTTDGDPGDRPIWMLSSGRFFAVIDEDDEPYRYRVRVAGRSTVAGQGVRFYVAILPATSYGLAAAFLLDPSATPTAAFDTTSGTASWLAGSDYTVRPSRAALASAQTTQSTRTGPAGKPTAVYVSSMHAVVYGERVSGATAKPELYGLHVSVVR